MNDEHEQEIARIVRVFVDNGKTIDKELARSAWHIYSEDMAAGFLSLPDSDEELLRIVSSVLFRFDVEVD